MKLVKVRKEKVSVKVKMTRQEKTIVKNLIALGMIVGGIGCFMASVGVLLTCDPTKTLLAVPDMLRFELVGTVLVFAGPILKYAVSVN